MTADKAAHYEKQAAGNSKKIFDFLFPSTPAINSLVFSILIWFLTVACDSIHLRHIISRTLLI